jgi:fibronectin type 3 domain-containing protein
MSKSKLPKNWDETRVKSVLEHYEGLSDEAAAAEDEVAYNATTSTSMDVPVDLVPKVRELIAKRKAS